MSATLLVELLTEELPPKSLQRLSQAFCDALFNDLKADRLLGAGGVARALATPRRLSVLVTGVLAQAADESVEVQGPSVKVGLGPDGKPTPALAGFARKNGVDVDALVQVDTPKGRVFAARKMATGAHLDATLEVKVAAALHKLPIPKLMRWGDGDAQFVRPAHRLTMLHGERLVAGSVLGLASGRTTLGHRFMSTGEISITSADTYERELAEQGMVIADFAARRQAIDAALRAQAEARQASLGEYADLLDEVAALVEHPSVYVGEFEAAFLEVPQECLILTMRQNQKYFPLFNAAGRLLPQFLIVSNMQVSDASHIIGGNQRVVRPRLEDARFFYTQDRKQRLESRVPPLEKVVYHNKLGNQLERVMRVQQMAGRIARALGADPVLAERAAWLAKADLQTGMVGEFPELQGVMGRYYALNDGEPQAVADAIEAHYRPRFAGDRLPEGPVACAVALADKLDTLVGIFGIGGAPTGDKDPFALRRHALGCLRILLEARLPLELGALLSDTAAVFPAHLLPTWSGNEVQDFMLERLKNLLREQGHAQDEIDAVVSQGPERIDQVPARLDAVRSFRALPESASLAAANKRITNILKRSEGEDSKPERTHMTEPAELALLDDVQALAPRVESALAAGDYVGALTALAGARASVDRFFEEVMVNAEDPVVRANRIALLRRLHALMNCVADISRLAA